MSNVITTKKPADDLQSKSSDWFLYDGNAGRLLVKDERQAAVRICSSK